MFHLFYMKAVRDEAVFFITIARYGLFRPFRHSPLLGSLVFPGPGSFIQGIQ